MSAPDSRIYGFEGGDPQFHTHPHLDGDCSSHPGGHLPHAHDEDRLTDEDRRRITAAMVQAVDDWRHSPSGYTPRWADLSTLERIGAGVIGCDISDLRDAEVEWLRSAGTAALGLDGAAS